MAENEDLMILKLVQDSGMPVGAAYLGKQSGIPQATVGRILLKLEQKGFLRKISNKGRLLTPEGSAYISQQEHLYNKLETARSIIEAVEAPSKHKLYEILEIRIALESLAVWQACQNVKEDDLHQLDTILLEHFYDLQRGGIGSEQDLLLHLKIAQMSSNHTLEQLLRLILTQENAYTKFSHGGSPYYQHPDQTAHRYCGGNSSTGRRAS